MKKYRIMAAVFAVLTGLFVFLFLISVRNSADKGTIGVVVAAVQIDKKTQLTAQMLKIQQMPAEAVHPDAARSLQAAVGKITDSTLEKGEQILVGKLVKQGTNTGGLAYRIPEGMRAFTIQVDTYSGVGGALRTGDKVDVIAEFDMAQKQSVDKVPTAIMLLQNKEILATSADSGSANSGSKSAYTSITLALSGDDALKLELTVTSGRYRFILRPPLEKGESSYQPRTIQSLQ